MFWCPTPPFRFPTSLGRAPSCLYDLNLFLFPRMNFVGYSFLSLCRALRLAVATHARWLLTARNKRRCDKVARRLTPVQLDKDSSSISQRVAEKPLMPGNGREGIFSSVRE